MRALLLKKDKNKPLRPVSAINNSWKKNLQVASTGEDEEDLWVVDGQQRTARRDDEHGCTLNSSVLFKRSGEATALATEILENQVP